MCVVVYSHGIGPLQKCTLDGCKNVGLCLFSSIFLICTLDTSFLLFVI